MIRSDVLIMGGEDELNRKPTLQPAPTGTQPTAKWELMPIDVAEVPAPRGEFILPAVNQVRLALALSDFSASWCGSRGSLSETVNAGTTTICKFNQARRLEMRNSTSFAIVLLRSEILEQALHDRRQPRVELQERYHLQDETTRHLIEVLLHEKRQGFQSGAFFLDSVTVALASYLIRYYSADSPVRANLVGGMTPSALRRCIALMEAHLEGDLRLDELAREAGLSTSHFIRSFRQSTGKTPYQFLLERRVERAQTLMRGSCASLTEIAKLSGFADQHHLARVFRHIAGITPSNYRRSL